MVDFGESMGVHETPQAVRNSTPFPKFLSEKAQELKQHIIGKFANNTDISSDRMFETVGPDIMDNLPFPFTPLTIENNGRNTELIDTVLPPNLRQNLLQISSHWPPETTSGNIMIVGEKDTKTNHPHLFEMKKTFDGSVQLLFVDPEDVVGKSNFFRPQIVNVSQAVINQNGDASMAFLRYRTQKFEHSQLQLVPLYEQAQKLLDTRGKPDLLQDKEKEIIFRLNLTPDNQTLQSRYVTYNQQQSFLNTGNGAMPLEGKRNSIRAIFQRFATFQKNPDEKSQKAYMNFKNKLGKDELNKAVS